MLQILIRFNHDAKSDSDRWRFLMNGKEYNCADVFCYCPTRTIKHDIIGDDGKVKTKWHVTPLNPREVTIEHVNNDLIFIVK
jgi:hypothetical protein